MVCTVNTYMPGKDMDEINIEIICTTGFTYIAFVQPMRFTNCCYLDDCKVYDMVYNIIKERNQ